MTHEPKRTLKFVHLCVLEKSAIQQQNDTCASLGPPYNEFKLFQSQEFVVLLTLLYCL